MGLFQKLFKQTVIYGLATVVPRMLSFLLMPLYIETLDSKAEYGELSIVFSWMVLFNVLLAYGMETSFFRFFHNNEHKGQVVATSTISILVSTLLFAAAGFLFRDSLAEATAIEANYLTLVVAILALDAVVIIPFAWLRANEKPMRYAVIKIGNVAVNLGLNVFFLVLLPMLAEDETSVFNGIYRPDFQISYIFISNLIASGLTLLVLLPFYLRLKFRFDATLWKKMISYGTPILISGIAFAINEVSDKIFLERLLPPEVALAEVGAYSAGYKLALFMTLFATAFRMGIEPFFFSHAAEKDARQTYAVVTKYFVIFGSFILVGVTVFADVLKMFLIPNESYWEAMVVVPIILLANLFLGIYHNLSVWYKVSDRTRFAAYISVMGAIVTIVFNILLIPHFGYLGSAVTTLAAYGTMMLLSYYFGRKHYRVPYDLKKIGAYLGLSIVFSAVSFYLFRSNLYIGCFLILIFFALIYFAEKDELKRVLKA